MKKRLIIIGLLALVLSVALAWFYLPRTGFVIKRNFRSKLSKLELQVNAIPSSLKSSGSTEKDLNRYDSQMTDILNSCTAISAETERTLDFHKSEELVSAITKTGKLCEDLQSVANYSKALYDSSRDYLLLNDAPWRETNSSEFSSRLQSTTQNISEAEQRLKQIDYPQVADPALQELLSEVDGANKLLVQLKSEIDKMTDNGSLNNRLSDFQSYLKRDRQSFMDARSYFWNNTVGIESLRKAISQLKNSFR